jgi:adenylate cyclase class IV
MKEIEAKFLEIDIKSIRKKIKAAGGKKIHSLMMYKRYAFSLPDSTKKGYARVRQENKKVTMTIKTYDANSKYANESEIELKSTLEEGRELLLVAGFNQKAYQESLREKWSIDGCNELCIDCIPGLPTYLEIECSNETNLKKVAKLLDFDLSKAEYGAFDKQFVDYYGFTKEEINEKTPLLTFKNIEKDLKFIRKNKELINKVKKEHLELINKLKIKK